MVPWPWDEALLRDLRWRFLRVSVIAATSSEPKSSLLSREFQPLKKREYDPQLACER